MASPVKSPFPQALRLSIDDLGEFILLVGDHIPAGDLLPGLENGETGVVCTLARSLHGGAQWQVSGMGEPHTLEPGGDWTLGARTYRIEQPDPASPLLCLRAKDSEAPSILLLAEGVGEGFDLGLPGCAWEMEGIQHAVLVEAHECGLRIACEGGVRHSEGDGEFDGARPFQEAPWGMGSRQMFWNSARAGSGAPFFITLDPMAKA